MAASAGGALVMASEDKKPKAACFDGEAARSLVTELRETFDAGKTKSYEWRVSQLKSLLKLTKDHENDIIEALRTDLSKPVLEAFVSEIAMLKSSCEFTLKQLKRWMVPEKVKTSITTFPSSAEIVPEPLGVVLVISAWNYPFLLSLDPVIGAIAAGNAVILKPSEIAPATSSLLVKLLGEYMDSSAVKVIEGAVPETSALLEQKTMFPFKVNQMAKRKFLLKVTARRIIAGKWGMNNGQACISADHIITTKDFAPKLIDALKVELVKFYGNEPLVSEDLSRIVSSNHFARVTKLLDDDKVAGKIVHGGQKDQNNLKIAPTILLDVPEDCLMMNEEIFGPLLPIVTVNNLEDSFKIINSREKPLAAYIFTTNKRLKEAFVKNVSAGGLLINDVALHIANPYLPFGGVGESGMGSYHGRFSFDTFTHKKAVLYRSFAGDASARYPPYTPGKLKLLKALLSGNILGIIRALIGW
uniref:Aldehyde dehydrogenase n=1 Tax=Actinidia deliciosa TaxID=3627 RepID=A0A8A2FC57_ACTDE|nr:aldehyde dehydrogenase 2 [Actinidia deliciosa]